MTTRVNYHILASSMIVNFEGKTVTLTKEDARYEKVLQAIKDGRLEDVPALTRVDNLGPGLEVVDGVIIAHGTPMPHALSRKILQFKEAGIPYGPLVQLWERIRLNGSFNSRQQLYAFLEHNGHPITEDGKFIAYRSVTSEFKDFHTRTFDNSVGAVCEVPRESVDDNPNNTCSHGLHVACFSYAVGFGGSDRRIVEVEVDPADVVCVPTDYNGTKMRVCKFKVVAETDKESVDLFRASQPKDTCCDHGDDEDFDDADDEEDDFYDDEDDCDEDDCGEDDCVKDDCDKDDDENYGL